MTIKIEVIYATPERQLCLPLCVDEGSTVEDAIIKSNIQHHFPHIEVNKVGIFGKLVSLSHLLSDGDRVEIYRPLLVDPKQARKLRASK